MRRRRLWTADQHYGHLRISELAERPWAHDADGGVRRMNRYLTGRQREYASAGDETWNLGDFAMGQIRDTLPLAGQLPGEQVLVCGNHDRPWSGHGRKALGWEQKYLDAGFTRVLQSGRGETPLCTTIAGQEVLICHFPYQGDSREKDRHASWRLEDQGLWLLHGHVHQRWRQRGRMINVGVDAWGGRPVMEEEIEELIESGPRDLPPLRWMLTQER